MRAARTIWRYGIPVTSAIRNATTPITGGMICPPDDAAASTAPANVGRKPARLMIGIVNTPVETTLAIGEPESVPNAPEATIAACAGPPVIREVAVKAIFRRVL